MDQLKAPYILLDDARLITDSTHRSFLQSSSQLLLIATAAHQISGVLEALDDHVRKGATVSGWISYEVAGYFEPRLAHLLDRKPALPFIWLSVAYGDDRLPGTAIEAYWDSQAEMGQLSVSESEAISHWFHEAFCATKRFIDAGDCYQINLTYPLAITYKGDIEALYAALRRAQPAPFASIIHTGNQALLSLSPEQFLTKRGQRLQSVPMKGTARRALDAKQDQVIKQGLKQDEKNRAENLMIVDLLRNDIAKISSAGTVRVPSLYHVESYPTVHQMVSTIEAEAKPGLTPSALLGALFPCGSVTGAPKIRAMEIIHDLEKGPRGPYCGSIVRFQGMDHLSDWSLSVPIRTLVFDKSDPQTGCHEGVLNVGAGLVADSDEQTELSECRLKADFTKPRLQSPMISKSSPPNLIETMRVDMTPHGMGSIPHLEMHLARLTASAAYFNYPINIEALRDALKNRLKTASSSTGSHKLKLEVTPGGAVTAITLDALESKETDHSERVVQLGLADISVRSDDIWLYHKSTNRHLYSKSLAAARNLGLEDLIFCNEKGEVTESSIYSIFWRKGLGLLKTPPLCAGLLPGILRQSLLDNGEAVECTTTLEDIKSADDLYVGNSVRGVIRAKLAYLGNGALRKVPVSLDHGRV